MGCEVTLFHLESRTSFMRLWAARRRFKNSFGKSDRMPYTFTMAPWPPFLVCLPAQCRWWSLSWVMIRTGER